MCNFELNLDWVGEGDVLFKVYYWDNQRNLDMDLYYIRVLY